MLWPEDYMAGEGIMNPIMDKMSCEIGALVTVSETNLPT